jgi:hypothetical protein
LVPTHFQSFPEFFVRYVQVPLCLLHARVSEYQLNHADVNAVSQQPARAFVAQVVPPQIDPVQVLAIPGRAVSARPRRDLAGDRRPRMTRWPSWQVTRCHAPWSWM